jgi:hypothetical protein
VGGCCPRDRIRYPDLSSEHIYLSSQLILNNPYCNEPAVKISFPGGAGGQWLLRVLLNFDDDFNRIHFHGSGAFQSVIPGSGIDTCHELDPAQFTHLLGGDYYFNFYANVVYKLFHHDLNWFKTKSYQHNLLNCVNNAKFICAFANIRNRVTFDWHHLIHSPTEFYQAVVSAQQQVNKQKISFEKFLYYRDLFLSTCVNIQPLWQNWDNMLWISWVLGQLMEQNIVPLDFSISDPENQYRCINFARENYAACKFDTTHVFLNGPIIPILL